MMFARFYVIAFLSGLLCAGGCTGAISTGQGEKRDEQKPDEEQVLVEHRPDEPAVVEDGGVLEDDTAGEAGTEGEEAAGEQEPGADDGGVQFDGDGQATDDGQPAGNVWRVGPSRQYKTPCEVSSLVSDGDVVEIDAGLYRGDVCKWTANRLTLRGVGGYAHLDANGQNYGGKAIWVIQGNDTIVEWIEFSGATVPDRNGAGIRQEGDNLTVRHCFFHDNEDGILGGGGPESVVTIENSEFARNGYGDGYSHNLYIGRIKRLVFRANYSHHARIGHNLKSRAAENMITYNRIMDEADGTSSYAIDLPNGGLAVIVGNLVQQGPNTDNSTIVSYGAEGLVHPVNELHLVNNTVVNDRSAGTFVRVATGTSVARLVNNLFVGPGTVLNGTAEQSANLQDDGSCLVDRTGFDYHIVAGCGAVDAGIDPGSAHGIALAPAEQYLHPASTEPRPSNGPLDVGAYELR